MTPSSFVVFNYPCLGIRIKALNPGVRGRAPGSKVFNQLFITLSRDPQCLAWYQRPTTNPEYPKKNGKERTIHNPISPLKTIQSRIQKRILAPIELPIHVQGGVRSRSPLTNASLHSGNEVVVAIDIRDFFPSVTDRWVFQIWREQLGFGRDAAKLLTRLTTFNNQLPQGSPTSTSLANLAMLCADSEIQAGLARGLNYSRFVDDITISGGDEAAQSIPYVAKILSRYGLRTHRSKNKCKVMRAGSAQTVTGLTVNEKIAVPDRRRQQIRAAVFKLEKASSQEQEELLPEVLGQVNWLRHINSAQSEKLLARVVAVIREIEIQVDRCGDSTYQ